MDAASAVASAQPVSGIAPVTATDDGVSDDTPYPPLVIHSREEDEAPETLLDAIDPDRAYRAALSVLRRQGMVGLLLNRNA